MREFFKSLFASFFALVLFTGIGFVLCFVILVAAGSSSKPTVASKTIVVMNLDGTLVEHAQDPNPSEALSAALNGGAGRRMALSDLLEAVETASGDERVAALYLTGNLQGGGPAQLRELRQALVKFAAKKPLVAWNLNYGRSDYYLASAANQLLLHPFGLVQANGFSAEPMFYGGAFKKYGVEVQVTRVGKFKSAVEPYILDHMSAENREQIQTLLGDLWSEWKATVGEGRKLDVAALQALADEKGMLRGEEAKAAKLVDRLANTDEVLDRLKELAGKQAKDKDFPQIEWEAYRAAAFSPKTSGDQVAVLFAEGEIVDGEGGSQQVGGDRVARELRRLRMDDRVKAVVLRVNSPGGSAQASEVIQREVILTKAKKPVVISMSHLAASGGYWISAYGSRVLAEPSTITGSIGVFGLLPNVQKLAAEHGITWDSVQTAKLSNPQSLARPKNPEELARIQAVVDDIYARFLDKVAEGRKLKRDAVHEIAQGRVWSGQTALKLGLVDELGGLQESVKAAAKLANLADYSVKGPDHEPDGFMKAVVKGLTQGKPRRVVKAGPVDQLKTEMLRQFEVLEGLNDPQGAYARMPFELGLK
ncbi:MAG TPA: signal peptide peptidase SppA [Holophagaceae bacterium]|nr:signal peptide peptidase SppA [Holophagaceae bacterium]